MPTPSRALRFALLALLAVSALGLLERAVLVDLGSKRDLHRVSYVGSANCLRCHADHDRSWRATFHRTMTQAASITSVAGEFAGQTLDYFGVKAQLERGAGGEFVMRYGGAGFPERRFVIEKTVGSRRYQQYVASLDGEFVRLPVAFDLTTRRWFHMNGAFLTPDPEPSPALSQRDYERHLTRWNDNCIFCHNVAPNPGRRSSGFQSEVAELGIACEACHGPGGEHAERNQNPLRRFTLHLGGAGDPTIVNPGRLDHERAADLCGRCHGQRITDDVGAFLSHGDPFVPGEDLALYSAPLWRDTTLQGHSSVFEARFWEDGTPRLTAYEYQGLLQSPCYQRGELSCTSCHGMHDGDPRGQLRSGLDRTRVCTECHRELREQPSQSAHARHPGTPPDCVSCHMPSIVYGVLATHPSHRIETPEPARAYRTGRPDACTLCHTDRTRAWAARERRRLFGGELPIEPEATAWSEMETQLLAGDPIERAIAAQALATPLGGPQTPHAGRARALLLEAIEHDPYPVVRRFAARALAALEPTLRARLAQFVPETPTDQRSRTVNELKQSLAGRVHALPAEVLSSLRERASASAIEIGE
ncbi:MAG: cytochrome c3 family protein [Myxococcales bacterium]